MVKLSSKLDNYVMVPWIAQGRKMKRCVEELMGLALVVSKTLGDLVGMEGQLGSRL